MTVADNGTLADTASPDEVVYRRIYQAVLEHRLLPGTRLPEEKLAAIFSVSRARVRKVLGRLQNEGLVEVVPNRGAFIAQPTIDQSNDIFEARRAIEPAIMRRLASRGDTSSADELSTHVQLEFDARDRDEQRRMIRLSGEFHNLAGELAGNFALARPIRELSALTCLAILLYESPTSTACRADQHAEIVRRIATRDGDGAAKAVVEHLDEIQRSMRFPTVTAEADLESILGD
ncbi:GntR family transcriptional regulator [Streptomyces tendae]|uniref:GntR family transcriptional regulator n=1 Tax=Streptomyces tendae TaxID=1932 RepID=UPI0036D0B178